jgi:glucokinase
MLLAGDVGGTKTLVGVFAPGEGRPVSHVVRTYPTSSFHSFSALLDDVLSNLDTRAITAAAFGVAGPVSRERSRLTNVEWDVSADELRARLGGRPVRLLNDLEATAHALRMLTREELIVLQPGDPAADGHMAVIAAGTGLGEAYLRRTGDRWVAAASEGGHADFAARTDREMELVRMLRERHGRAEVEHVVSGPGLVNLHRLTHRGGQCDLVEDVTAATAPSAVSRAGMGDRCQGCAEALRMFVSAYGAEAGNLALRGLALGGVYVGGGIAPQILPALQSGVFMEAFLAKAPMAELLSRVPVSVIVRSDCALLGAAVCAQELVGGS